MNPTILIVLTVAIVAPSACAAGTAPATALDGVGDIVEIGKLFEPLCPCGRGLELVDAAGNRVMVAIGPAWDELKSGFRLGATSAGDSASVAVEKGSRTEQRLLDLMWGYLDRHYTYWEQERLREPASRQQGLSSEEADAAYLLEFLGIYERQEEMQRWLDHNLPRDEQERIFNSPYGALDSEFERRVFRYVCSVRGGGTWIESASGHREIDGEFSEVKSGSCR